MKKFLTVGLTALMAAGAFAGEKPVFGPRVNPDDQYRFFWFINPQHLYPYGRDMGLNLVYDPYSSRWFSMMTPEEQKAETLRRRTYLEKLDRDGIDVIEFVTANDRIGKPECMKLKGDGTRDKHALDCFLPATKALMKERWTRAAESMKGLPAIVAINALSEPYYGGASFAKEFEEACQKALGFAPLRDQGPARLRSDFPLSGIVSKDYRPLAYGAWYWRGGNGWDSYVEECAQTYREVWGRDIPVAYDPVTRCPPLWGSGCKNLSLGNQWFYALPQPYGSSFMVSEEKAMARGTPGMQIFTMLQAMLYRSIPAPKDKTPANPPQWTKDRPNAGYISMPPDMMREALWTLFSRQIAGMGFHGGNSMFDVLPITPEENREKVRLGGGYQFTNPELRLAVRDAFHRAGIPLGPLFKAVPERAPEVGLLQCYASTILTGLGCGFGWGSPYGDLIVGANFTPHVLYEQEIVRDGIPPTMKVILAPDCAAMLDTTRDALLAFQKRGGIVLGDEKLAPGVLADFDLPEGLLNRFCRQERSNEDRAILKRVIPQLKRDLAPYVTPYADSENGDLVVSARTYRNADYVFAINDKRTFGDYVGPWGRLEEKGLPNAGVVTVARADTKAVYDLVAHQAVPFRVANGKTEIDVTYTTTDGRIFLVAPHALGDLEIRRDGDAVVVTSADKDVMIPIKVEVDGAKPRYGVLADGVWKRPYATGANLRVTNLADSKMFIVKKEEK